ncbi:hypothetical protein MAPG_11791 [Magnaporthiopsis poae ATCC 64411]|uniref:Heterokaryon incompatibility domain-containing protein n=1 Tax=Magnaporthiopsis poae (strain ATCC 64411 / 73-15) TaxID=644358 RepID=A0A0C4EG68_MAGP6|nr:hypothetical protein MAPG_11791 [Magnaporthiopsis poae ATCC 64411]
MGVLPDLPDASSQIRLLRIHPGDGDSPIECSYSIASLDAADLKYETVSYVWGDVKTPIDKPAHILVDGSPIRLGENAHRALRRLRKPDQDRTIWIDALCIEQSDDVEKTEQVKLMGRIYKSCTQCAIFWGGEDGVDKEGAKMAFEVISWMARDGPRPSWLHDEDLRVKAAAAFKSAMVTPWWLRIWTVQEALLPPASTVYWCGYTLPFSSLHEASEIFFQDDSDEESSEEDSGDDESDEEASSEVGTGEVGASEGGSEAGSNEGDSSDDSPEYFTIGDPPHEFSNNGSFNDMTCRMRGLAFCRWEDPLSLLWRWRFRRSTDPRDKVYGLLGFRDDVKLPSANASDYTIDVCTLFASVTVDLIRSEQNLRALIGWRGTPHNIAGLPSWAVDWTIREAGWDRSRFYNHNDVWNSQPLAGASADHGMRNSTVTLETIDEPVPGRPGMTRPRALVLSGIYVDKIAVVGPREPDHNNVDGDDEVDWIMSESPRWCSLVRDFEAKHPGKLRLDWMRALIGVVTGKSFPRLKDIKDGEGDECGVPPLGQTQRPGAWHSDMLSSQSLFITEGGLFGLGPCNATPGQEVWVVGGTALPLLLQRREAEGESEDGKEIPEYTFASDAIVYGVMNGEAVKGTEGEEVTFRLY